MVTLHPQLPPLPLEGTARHPRLAAWALPAAGSPSTPHPRPRREASPPVLPRPSELQPRQPSPSPHGASKLQLGEHPVPGNLLGPRPGRESRVGTGEDPASVALSAQVPGPGLPPPRMRSAWRAEPLRSTGRRAPSPARLSPAFPSPSLTPRSSPHCR